MMRVHTRFLAVVSWAVLSAALLALPAFAADDPPPKTPPTPPPAGAESAPAAEVPAPLSSPVEERVDVRLVEVQVLVTDRKGAAITDLRPEEITVREGKAVAKLAYVEPYATRNLAAMALPGPTPLTGPDDEVIEQGGIGPRIPAPLAERWITLLFDAYNGRIQDRAGWVAAARTWVAREMRDGDRVALAVVDDEGVEFAVPFTADKTMLSTVLGNDTFLGTPIPYDAMADIRKAIDDLDTCRNAYDPFSCSTTALQPYLYEWAGRADRTLRALDSYVSSLAAIPGRKLVFLMSPGFVADAGEVATHTILSVFGTDLIDIRDLRFRLQRSMQTDMLEVLRHAAESDVTFFTFDTRPAHLTNQSVDVDLREKMHERRTLDPFNAMFQETRGSLDTIAIQSGGRAIHGTRVVENLARGIGASEGLYTVGFYRDASATRRGRLRVDIDRRGAEVTFPDRFDPRRSSRATAPLELAIGESHPAEDGILLPVMMQMALTHVETESRDPLFGGETGGDAGLHFAVYAEAITPQGERVASIFETVAVNVPEHDVGRLGELKFAHRVNLIVPPGAYRVRVRVADAGGSAGADRAVDITVDPQGKLEAGIRDLGSIQNSERTKP